METSVTYKYYIDRIKSEVVRSDGKRLTNSDIANELGYSRVHLQRLMNRRTNADDKYVKDLLSHFTSSTQEVLPHQQATKKTSHTKSQSQHLLRFEQLKEEIRILKERLAGKEDLIKALQSNISSLQDLVELLKSQNNIKAD